MDIKKVDKKKLKSGLIGKCRACNKAIGSLPLGLSNLKIQTFHFGHGKCNSCSAEFFFIQSKDKTILTMNHFDQTIRIHNATLDNYGDIVKFISKTIKEDLSFREGFLQRIDDLFKNDEREGKTAWHSLIGSLYLSKPLSRKNLNVAKAHFKKALKISPKLNGVEYGLGFIERENKRKY